MHYGVLLGSISVFIISAVGWRGTLAIIASYGIVIGSCLLIVIKEPARGMYEPRPAPTLPSRAKQLSFFQQYWKGVSALFVNKTSFWVTMGAAIRFWQEQTMAYFNIDYFNGFNKDSAYSLYSALALVFCGAASNVIAGYLSDKFELRNYRTKSYLGTGMCLIAVPLCILMYLVEGSFAFSMTMFFFEQLLTEGWMPPTIAMV